MGAGVIRLPELVRFACFGRLLHLTEFIQQLIKFRDLFAVITCNADQQTDLLDYKSFANFLLSAGENVTTQQQVDAMFRSLWGYN